MLDKKELLEEIEIFEKLDIIYILEVLQNKLDDNNEIRADKTIELDSNMIETIKELLSALVRHSDNFRKIFNLALVEIDSYNKVANIDIEDTNISKENIEFLYALLKNIALNHQGFGDNVAGDKTTHNTNSVNISGSNSGDIIINTKDIDYASKLKNILSNLPIGNILFNAPKNISLNESKKAILRISKQSIDISNLPQNNQQIEEKLEIYSFMSAKLMSFDFDIMNNNHEEQAIGEKDFTEWSWYITPKIQKDKGVLLLRISIRIPLDKNKEEKKDLPLFEKNIDILVKEDKILETGE